jgi:hypothetical protein
VQLALLRLLKEQSSWQCISRRIGGEFAIFSRRIAPSFLRRHACSSWVLALPASTRSVRIGRQRRSQSASSFSSLHLSRSAFCPVQYSPPCKKFTPILTKFVTTHGERLKLKTIFLSNDNSSSDYDEYFGTMTSFLSAGFESPETSAMGEKYNVEGIPTLIIFDKEGNVVTDKGTAKLMRDTAGAAFPWRPTPLKELVEKMFPAVDQEGAATPYSAVQDLEAIGIYFSAHWYVEDAISASYPLFSARSLVGA